MLGISDLLENSSGDATAGNHEGEVGVDGSITGGFEEEERGRGEDSERNLAGNRWPRQETLALLKIRSDMDGAFRDSAPKAPLWEEVSRKLAELGYHRSAKKCKEKFENVYKYHKRTKEGRTSRHDGKTYRFFDQLQALDNHPISLPPLSSPKPLQTPTPAMPIPYPPPTSQQTLPSSVHNPITTNTTNPDQILTSPTSCSSSSEEEAEGSRRKKKKLSAFFDKLMKEVVERQEILQKRFLEAIEKRERERMAREEAWKMQEVARLNREHEMLVQERSIAAAKDAAVIAFLQKISDQSNPLQIMEVQSQENPSPSKKIVENPRTGNADNFPPASSSRWPKAEVEALIRLRTSLDVKYQDNGSKGPLWEEISTAMRKVGYNRSAKRCKEKWENINKYYKKVKESNKKRPEDSKTCPYFHQLDALYKEKTKKIDNSFASGFGLNSENQPQPLRQEPQRPQSVMEDLEPESTDPNQEEDGDDEDEDEDEGGDYEIVSNNPSSVAIVG